MAEEKRPEEKVTEGKETEDETIPEFGKDGRDARLYKLHALMNECVSLARETVEGEFGDLASVKGDSLGHFTTDLAVALFHKASVPDQTETMLAALERGLEWYSARDEKQQAESAKRNEEFRAAMPKQPRAATALEILVRNLIEFTSRFAEVELTKLSDEVEEARETVTGGEIPTPEE